MEASGSVERFYGRWAWLYDRIARRTPTVGRFRGRAADALALEPGDAVVEMGCGTGANLPYLRERVGPEGTVVGVDLTGPMLARARALVAARGWENVHLLRADAARPPLDGGFDAVLATFVVGMFEDPAAVVDGWCDLAAGGRVALLDAVPSDRAAAVPANLLFDAFTRLSTPPTLRLRYPRSPVDKLDARVSAARTALAERAAGASGETFLLGFVDLTYAPVE